MYTPHSCIHGHVVITITQVQHVRNAQRLFAEAEILYRLTQLTRQHPTIVR